MPTPHHFAHRSYSQCLALVAGACLVFVVVALAVPSDLSAQRAGAPTGGNTYVVNSTLDEPDADQSDGKCLSFPSQHCTLRAAIMQANFATGPNTITVPAGVYMLTRPGYDNNSVVGDLDINHDLTIQGAGSGVTIIDGNGAVTGDRVFQVLTTANAVTLTGMTIRNGQSLSSTVGVIGGGGLYMEGAGHLSLSDVILERNTGQNGGGLYANFSSLGGSIAMDHVSVRANTAIAGGVGAGGGVYAHLPSSASAVDMQDSQVYSNTADGTGGGLYVDGNTTAHWSIERSEIYSNTAASGGGIGNFVPLVLSDSRLHDNHATFDGGAIEAYAPFAISRTTLNANSAGRFGGGIFDLATVNTPVFHELRLHRGEHAERQLRAVWRRHLPRWVHQLQQPFDADQQHAQRQRRLSPGRGNGSAEGGGIYVYGGQAQLLNATIASNRVQLGFPTPTPA